MQIAKWRLLAWCAVVWLGPSISAGGLSAASAATNEQMVATPVTATVIADAPIFVKVGMATPLRVASAGTTLRVLSAAGEWTQVQFQDPQFGLRTGWVSSKLIRQDQPALEPMDLSVPKAPGPSAPAPTAAPAAAPPAPGRTQAVPSDDEGPRREGAWFNIGFGFGSLGCEDCAVRDTGGSGGLAVGGTLNQHVLLGIGTTGFVRSYDGDLLSAGTLDGRVRVYPSRRSGFFLNGGVGLGSLSYLGESEFGLGAMLGLGWDIRVGRNVSVTPFWNGSAMQNSNVDVNFGQLGVGITIH